MTINEYFGLDEPNYNETIRESKTINVTYILKEDGFADIVSIDGDSIDEFYWQLEGPYHSYLDITEQVMDYIYEKLSWMEVDEYPITLNCNMTVDVRCDIIGYEKQYEDESGDFELDEDSTLRSLHIDVHCDDDSIKIEESINANMKINESLLFRDNGAGLADKGYIFTLQELGKLYDEMKDSDPVVSEYKNFSEWMNDTVESGLLEIVDERVFDESLNEADESQIYRGYKIVFHPGYSVWTNMKNYYKVYAPQGHLVGGKATLEKAKEMIDNRIVNKNESLKEFVDTSLNDNVKSWYLKAYPTDEVGQEIDNKITFNGVIQVLNGGGEIYDFLADDSVIRERVFSELSDRLGVDYDVIYYTWLYPDDHQITIKESVSGISDTPRYYVGAFYDNNYRGLADSLSTNDYDEAEDFAWKMVNDGHCIQFIDHNTGKQAYFCGSVDDYEDDLVGAFEDAIIEIRNNAIKESIDDIPNWFKSLYYEAKEKFPSSTQKDTSEQCKYIYDNTDMHDATLLKWRLAMQKEYYKNKGSKDENKFEGTPKEYVHADKDLFLKKLQQRGHRKPIVKSEEIPLTDVKESKIEDVTLYNGKYGKIAKITDRWGSPVKVLWNKNGDLVTKLQPYQYLGKSNKDLIDAYLKKEVSPEDNESVKESKGINESSQSRYIDQLTNSIWNLIPNDPQNDKNEFEWVMEHCIPWGNDEDYPEEKSELKAKLSKLTLKTLIHIGLKCENKFGYPFIWDSDEEKYGLKENNDIPTIEDMFKSVGVKVVFDDNGYLTDEAYNKYGVVAKKYFNGNEDALDKLCSEENCFAKSLDEKLIQSDSDKAFKKNVATEIKAGKDPKQALAIAYSVKRKNESVDDGWEEVSGRNGYRFFRKIEDGKGKWRAQKVVKGEPEGEPFDITYEQALGREPIEDKPIAELSKKLGKILLPKSVKESDEIKRYSDVVPKENRRYWYFTTHGVQPGSLPDDVNILEVRDGVNDKGTEGTFVLLDAILNTSELKYYDMKELAPQTECLGESLNISDEDFQQKLKNELQGKLQYHYKKLGYTPKEIEDYIMPVYKTEFRKGYGDDGSDALFIWVGAEVDYDELEELAQILNRVIQKYDKYAYFEPETTGRLIAVLWGDGTNESLNESDEEWHDTADREQIDEPDYIPDEIDRYEAIAHKMVYDSNGFTTDYTLYFDHNENNYFTVFGDNDLYGPEDSDHDWDFGPNEDEAFEWFEDYEGFVDDDDVDLELTDDDLEAGQWYE